MSRFIGRGGGVDQRGRRHAQNGRESARDEHMLYTVQLYGATVPLTDSPPLTSPSEPNYLACSKKFREAPVKTRVPHLELIIVSIIMM